MHGVRVRVNVEATLALGGDDEVRHEKSGSWPQQETRSCCDGISVVGSTPKADDEHRRHDFQGHPWHVARPGSPRVSRERGLECSIPHRHFKSKPHSHATCKRQGWGADGLTGLSPGDPNDPWEPSGPLDGKRAANSVFRKPPMDTTRYNYYVYIYIYIVI